VSFPEDLLFIRVFPIRNQCQFLGWPMQSSKSSEEISWHRIVKCGRFLQMWARNCGNGIDSTMEFQCIYGHFLILRLSSFGSKHSLIREKSRFLISEKVWISRECWTWRLRHGRIFLVISAEMISDQNYYWKIMLEILWTLRSGDHPFNFVSHYMVGQFNNLNDLEDSMTRKPCFSHISFSFNDWRKTLDAITAFFSHCCDFSTVAFSFNFEWCEQSLSKLRRWIIIHKFGWVRTHINYPMNSPTFPNLKSLKSFGTSQKHSVPNNRHWWSNSLCFNNWLFSFHSQQIVTSFNHQNHFIEKWFSKWIP
jgi:hypothetical protein